MPQSFRWKHISFYFSLLILNKNNQSEKINNREYFDSDGAGESDHIVGESRNGRELDQELLGGGAELAGV